MNIQDKVKEFHEAFGHGIACIPYDRDWETTSSFIKI